MKEVHLEDGYTRIANRLLEVIQMFQFSTNDFKVIMCVWRFTYGFQRLEHSMSLSFIEQHTGLTRSRVNLSLKKLVENNVLKVRKGNGKQSNIYSFNKYYKEWGLEYYSSFEDQINGIDDDGELYAEDLIGSVQNDTSKNSTSVQNDTISSVQNDTTTSVQNDTQERKILNKHLNININDDNEFDQFWNIYIKKAGKQKAKTSFKKARKKNSLEEILAGTQNYMNKCKAENTQKQFIKDPSTFLNNECYLDEHEIYTQRQFNGNNKFLNVLEETNNGQKTNGNSVRGTFLNLLE